MPTKTFTPPNAECNNPRYGVGTSHGIKLLERQWKARQKQLAVGLREAERAVPGGSRVDWEDEGLSIRRLREAVAETAFPQLLRAGVQNFLFDGYEQVAVIYPDLVRSVNSDKYEELYAPMYGAELPHEVRPGQKFEGSRLKGLDKRLRNIKFGRMLEVERELVEDDQTGQIVQKASEMGERIRYVEEQAVMNAITSATYTTAIGNRVETFGLLSQAKLEEIIERLHLIKDPLGQLIMVQPDTLLVSPSDEFNAAKLLQSALQPSVPGAAGHVLGGTEAGTGVASGGTGWTMTINPLQGLLALKVSRFLPSKFGSTKGSDGTNGAALVGQAKKSLVFQDRAPLEVTQEPPNTGESFNRDQYRWRTRRRFNTGMIESRYWGRIN